MPELDDMPSSGEGSEETSTEPEAQAIVEQPEPEPAPKQVDLAAEAGDVVAKQPRSLDELGLDTETRSKVDSYLSRQINDARDKWDQRKQKEIDDGQFMTREEVSDLLTKQADDISVRETAKDSFVRNLGKLDIHVGSEEYDKVATYYADAAEKGLLNPQILTDETGLKMLVEMSGAAPKNENASSPSKGMPKAHPEGLQHGDGSIQLGKGLQEGQEMTLTMQSEKAMVEALRNSS